ncbi:MAG: hypothetical protein ACREMB_25365 [Candidatus Rokuibacteriota bacterium]
MTPNPRGPRTARGGQRNRKTKSGDRDPDPGRVGARASPLPERLQQVLDRAEVVIAETRRVIRDLLRDLRRQRAATDRVLTGQPPARAARRPRRRTP